MVAELSFAPTPATPRDERCDQVNLEEVVSVPPHCDSLDGPVVSAARAALEAGDVDLVLPFVPSTAEPEARLAFDLVLKARAAGGEAAEVADRWFFETAVRIHRAGEGASYTGLKPAGLDVGPVIPAAERALASGSPAELGDLLCGLVRGQVEQRLARTIARRPAPGATVAEQRDYVEAMLGLQVWSHAVHRQLLADPHEHAVAHARRPVGSDHDREADSASPPDSGTGL